MIKNRRNRQKAGDRWYRLPQHLDKDGNKIVLLEAPDGEPSWRRNDQLVAEAFIGPCPAGHKLVHKDGDKANCRLDNLEYVPE